MAMIRLQDELDVGSLDRQNYSHAKVTIVELWNVQENVLELYVAHGYLDSANEQSFAPGFIATEDTFRSFVVEGEDYVRLVEQASSAEGQGYMDHFMRALHQMLIDGGHYIGVVVKNDGEAYEQ